MGVYPELHDTLQAEGAEAGAILVSVGGDRHLGAKNASPFFGWAVNAGANVEIDGRPVSFPGGSNG